MPPTLLLMLLFLLVACGPTTPVYDQQKLEQANTAEQLRSLLGRMESELQQARTQEKNTQSLEQQVRQVRNRLAAKLVDDFRQQAEQERVENLVPMQKLQQGTALLQEIRTLDRAAAMPFEQWLEQELEQTEQAIREQRLQLGQTDPLLINQRLQQLLKLESLTGERQALLEEDLQNQYVDAIADQVGELIRLYRYPAAGELLAGALRQLPGNTRLLSLQARVQAELSANAFEQALEEGQPDQAFALAQQMTKNASLKQVADRLAPQIEALARFYAEQGRVALKNENWADAWQNYQRARKLLAWVDIPYSRLSTQVAELRKALQGLSVRARQEGLPGLQLTYLLMLQSWLDQPEELEAKLLLPEQETLNHAVHRLSISPFRSTDAHLGLGAALSARLTAELLQRIPHDVRVVERDELEAIIRERALDTRNGQRGMKIAPADFLVQGNILDATVEHAEKQSYQTERVQTGVRTVPNPEHAAWLSERKRNKLPEPPKTIEQPVFEDIRYAITLHKNTAVLSASYRLIDAATAKILKTSTITREKTVSDISSEGVQLGSYTKPLKLADLPSDSEMLKELLLEVAQSMSEELVQFLSHTEEEHIRNARQQAERGNYAEAAELAARAWVVARAKGKPLDGIFAEMVEYALQSGI